MNEQIIVYGAQSGEPLQDITAFVTGHTYGAGEQAGRTTAVRLDPVLSAATWQGLLDDQGGQRLIVTVLDGKAVACSHLVGWTEAPAGKSAELTLQDLLLLTGRRFLHGVGLSTGGGGYVPSGRERLQNRSRRAIVAHLAHRGLTDSGISPDWALPIDIGASAGDAGPYSLDAWHHNLRTVSQLLDEQTGADDGPDVDLAPKLVGGKLRHDLRVGTPYLDGPTFEFDLGAEQGAVTASSVVSDSRLVTTGIMTAGKGSGEDMRVGSAAVPPPAGLARDTVVSTKDIESVPELDGIARGRLAVTRRASRRITLSVHRSRIDITQLRLGALVRTDWPATPRHSTLMPTGWRTDRLTGWSTAIESQTIDLSLEPA